MANKKELSERDICTKYILPALLKAGWDIEKQIREEVSFTTGRIFIRGDKTARGQGKRADFILYLKPNIPVAVIEAKDNNYPVGAGLQQALAYAQTLDLPVAVSSNGDGFVLHDKSGFLQPVEKELSIDSFLSPNELWNIYKKFKGLTTPEQEKIALFDYFFDGSGRSPRYYQQIAINRAVEAIARGQKRFCLLWPQALAKPTPHFRSSIVFGKMDKRNVFSF